MSCNGCRVLRKGCGETCALRSCLQWIESPESQGHATLFLAKFFGRSDLMSLISSVPETKRPALFQSLLYEGCGRTINPVNGAVGLLWSGNWHVCHAAVKTVLAGGVLRPLPEMFARVSNTVVSKEIDTPLEFMHEVGEIMKNQIQKSRLDSEFDGNASASALKRPSASSMVCATTGESKMVSYGDHKKKQILNLFM